MKQTFLKLPKKPVRFAPDMLSRRMGLRASHLHNANFRSGGGSADADDDDDDDDDDAATEKKKFLKQVRSAVSKEIEQRQYQSADDVTKVINNVLNNMPLEALRSYTEDKDAMNLSIRNIAEQVEKFNKRAADVATHKTNVVMDVLNSKLPGEEQTGWQRIETAMRSKGAGQRGFDLVTINIRAAATMTTQNTIDDTTFEAPDSLVESMSMAEFVPKRRGQQFVYDIIDRAVLPEITQNKTWLEEGVEQGSFAIVAEGAVKPLVSTGLVRNYAVAKKVAGKYVVTEEFTKFRREAYTIIRRLIADKMLRDYAAILVVDLNANAAGYVGTTLDGTKANPSDYDALGAVAAQIETLNFVPDTLVIHPQDKWRLALETDASGRPFMIIPMLDASGVTTLMGFRVITSTYQTAGAFTLGEGGLFKVEEEPITVRMGYGIDVSTTTVNGTTVVNAVSSDFDTNKFRVIVETWFIDWLPTPYIGSYVKTTFAAVKAALLAP